MDQRVRRHWIAAMALAVVTVVALTPVAAEELSPQELKTALERVKGSAAFEKAAASTRDSRMVVASAWKSQGIIEILYFKYEGGTTLRAALDAASGEILELEELKAYPTPLADEEHGEAMRLAREQSGDVRRMLATTKGDDLGLYALPPVVSNPQDARYGHRIVLLTFFRKAERGPSVMVEVDLTKKTVRPFAG